MICNHCGKEYVDDANYCPYCAEPKPKIEPEPTMEEKIKENENLAIDIFWGIYCVCAGIFCIVFFILNPLLGIAGIILYGGIGALIRYYMVKYKKNHKPKVTREAMIAAQYLEDDTSICPRCGSHDIALGRKGYDWSKGFWYNLFGTPGAGYVAGMDSRRVTCYCQHCGHKWLSKQEWIK